MLERKKLKKLNKTEMPQMHTLAFINIHAYTKIEMQPQGLYTNIFSVLWLYKIQWANAKIEK